MGGLVNNSLVNNVTTCRAPQTKPEFIKMSVSNSSVTLYMDKSKGRRGNYGLGTLQVVATCK